MLKKNVINDPKHQNAQGESTVINIDNSSSSSGDNEEHGKNLPGQKKVKTARRNVEKWDGPGLNQSAKEMFNTLRADANNNIENGQKNPQHVTTILNFSNPLDDNIELKEENDADKHGWKTVNKELAKHAQSDGI